MTESDDDAPVLSFKAKLAKLFPPDHTDTPWLWRLAVLRDDLAHECKQLFGRAPHDPPSDLWTHSYALRKLAITVDEVKHIFTNEVQQFLAHRPVKCPPQVVPLFKDAVVSTQKAAKALKPIRDGLGAHVRPSNARKPSRDPTSDIIRAHGESVFEVQLDMQAGGNTSLRNMTAASFLFAWPDVVSEDDLYRKGNELRIEVASCLISMMRAIDMLLYMHWENLGIQAQRVG